MSSRKKETCSNFYSMCIVHRVSKTSSCKNLSQSAIMILWRQKCLWNKSEKAMRRSINSISIQKVVSDNSSAKFPKK